ncbi:MAG: 23S rRNA (pseudouridine(1915)-N(3))-methyltransferase RlmH [Verrucomicrobiales bacterium]|nr:23S rRNA (pseudouridine(1915)-N(3))-methyltransferase RlmH [Verrucomicrobiales bacterium]
MKWKLIVVGKPALAFAKSGVEEYLKRLRRYATVEIETIRESGPEENGRRQLQLSESCIRIVLDERGKGLTTADLVKKVEEWQMDGSVKRVAILIGGADGHTEETRAAADLLLKLSDFTLQHELALVALLEQIYRVHTVLKSEPYHR